MATVLNRFAATTALIGLLSAPVPMLAGETVTTTRTVRNGSTVVHHSVKVKKRHPVRKTVKRVGIGSAGGAVAGGLIGGGTGAAIGAAAGGGAGAIYDHHEKKRGK